MIRLRQNRCGYLGYTCSGVPALADEYASTTQSCAAGVTSAIGSIDNYKNIPTTFKGFVMQQPGVPTLMTVTSSDVPELECSIEMDPFSDGYWNMYAAPGIYGGVWWQNAVSAYSTTADSLLCFSTGGLEGPGILEPMLDTQFEPISIQAATNFDASIDGIMMTLMMITKWRGIIEDRINWIMTHLGGRGSMDNSIASGLQNLMSAMFTTDPGCTNFQIYKATGSAFHISGGTALVEPTYGCTGGTVTVNGRVPITVTGVTSFGTGECSAYLCLYIGTEDTTMATGGLPITSGAIKYYRDPNAKWIFPIGRVKKYQTASGATTRGYAAFEIEQYDCITDVALGPWPASAGVLYFTADSSKALPYISLPVSQCET